MRPSKSLRLLVLMGVLLAPNLAQAVLVFDPGTPGSLMNPIDMALLGPDLLGLQGPGTFSVDIVFSDNKFVQMPGNAGGDFLTLRLIYTNPDHNLAAVGPYTAANWELLDANMQVIPFPVGANLFMDVQPITGATQGAEHQLFFGTGGSGDSIDIYGLRISGDVHGGFLAGGTPVSTEVTSVSGTGGWPTSATVHVAIPEANAMLVWSLLTMGVAMKRRRTVA